MIIAAALRSRARKLAALQYHFKKTWVAWQFAWADGLSIIWVFTSYLTFPSSTMSLHHCEHTSDTRLSRAALVPVLITPTAKVSESSVTPIINVNVMQRKITEVIQGGQAWYTWNHRRHANSCRLSFLGRCTLQNFESWDCKFSTTSDNFSPLRNMDTLTF